MLSDATIRVRVSFAVFLKIGLAHAWDMISMPNCEWCRQFWKEIDQTFTDQSSCLFVFTSYIII